MTEPRPEPDSILPLVLDGIAFEAAGVCLLEVSAQIEAGGVSAVLGPNGAGKSLLLRIAHGLIDPTRGRVRCSGGLEGSAAAQRQAMVFAHPVMLRRSTAANIDYALSVRGWSRDRRAARTLEVLERTGLAPLADRPARRLSSGEQQRLAIARAWSVEPELLFLDEPTGSLDPAASASIEALIAELSTEGTKVVMTTHDLGQARRLAADVLFLHRGRLCERASARRFFDTPESADARAFLNGELLA